MDASRSSGAARARAEAGINAEFRLLIDAVAEGVCVLDHRARITMCNRTFLEMTGYDETAVAGRNVCEVLHPNSGETGGAPHSCELPNGEQELGERAILREYLLRKDGNRFPARCWLRPWRNSSGLYHLLTVEDITELEQTKEVLDRSQQRFRQILKNAPDVAWTSDLQGQTLYISPKVEAVLGYSKEEFCSGQQLRLGRIHPADFGRVYQAYELLFKNRSNLDVEYRFRHKNGKWIWVQDRATTTHEEDGVLYADGFLCDITERKEAEAELQFQTAFLEAQANSTIDGILVVDPAGRTLLRNQRFAEIFQLPKELQANREEGGTMRYAAALMKNPELFLSRVGYLYQHPSETARDELELINGIFLDRYSSPVVDKNGVYYGRIWTFRDITESKRNEDELQQLFLAVEQSPVSVIITDPEGKIGYVNRKFTECSGYTREEVVGRNPSILKSGQTSPEMYQDLWSTLKQGKVWSGELSNKKKNGEMFWEAASITPITGAKGEITHFLAVKEDITGRRRAERDLRLTQFSVDHASEAIQWLDAEGRIVYANDASCTTLKRSREELIGLAVTDARPVFSKEYWDKLRQELKQRNSMTFESQVQTKSGESVPVEINANYLRFDGLEYCFTFARDISERRALEAQLRQAQKLEGIGHLAAGIAHEINTPTQFVTDNLTFLQDSWKSIFELLNGTGRRSGKLEAGWPRQPSCTKRNRDATWSSLRARYRGLSIRAWTEPGGWRRSCAR